MKTTLTDPLRARRNLADRIHVRFAALGGLELPEIPREPMRRSAVFGEGSKAIQSKDDVLNR
jgi:hypothetical protein